jgi:hypothetical protein
MIGVEIVKDLMLALEAKEYIRASAYLSNDFTYTCMLPRPLNKREFITVMRELKEGLPDLSFNVHDIQEVERLNEEEEVTAAIQITGTHTDIFELVPLSLPEFPETGRRVNMPEEHLTYIIENEKIESITVQPVVDGGFPGLLAQLGVEAPIVM